MSTKLSIIILTYNEADVLARTMQAAAQVADELVIVDSHSSDNTLNVAEKNGATKIEVRNFVNWADQRNWAMEQSKYPWVLFIDADEVLNEQLIQAIFALEKESPHGRRGLLGTAPLSFFYGTCDAVFRASVRRSSPIISPYPSIQRLRSTRENQCSQTKTLTWGS